MFGGSDMFDIAAICSSNMRYKLGHNNTEIFFCGKFNLLLII